MSQSGILNRGVYPPGTVVETIQGSNVNTLVAPPISPDATNNIILNSTNQNLTFANGLGNILNITSSTAPIIAYRSVELLALPAPPTTITVVSTDMYIAVNVNGNGTITLPDPATITDGKQFIVKDTFGKTGPLPGDFQITINVAGGGTIDNALNVLINDAYDSLTFVKGSAIANNYEVI